MRNLTNNHLGQQATKVDKIIKIKMFELIIYKEVMSTSPKCFLGMDVMSS